MKIEYRVKTVERYIVTRYEEDENGSGVVDRGTYTSPHVAFEVGYALAKAEHERLGFAPGDERIIYPRHPHEPAAMAPVAETSFAIDTVIPTL